VDLNAINVTESEVYLETLTFIVWLTRKIPIYSMPSLEESLK
jgi:hypothetical protein